MSTVVAGFATSHTALMIRARAEADPQQVSNVMRGFAEVRQRLNRAAVDALLVIGSDHGKTFLLDNMPAFCIGVGAECEGWGDAGVPLYKVKVHQELARYLLDEAMEAGFDPAFSAEMKLDHGFMCPLHFILPEMDIPVVPLFVNSTCPPMPSVKRCHQLGGVLRKAIEKRGKKERIALLATGGLSHTVPTLDEFLYRNKRDLDPGMEQKKLAKIKEFVDQGLGRINESFDRNILELLTQGRPEVLIRSTREQIESAGGNGAQEIRNWVALLGALPDRKAEVLVYEPVSKWLTGIAIVAFN
jgi:aromatic ring-opening dioxygenase catalytic subunit (LigB family)